MALKPMYIIGQMSGTSLDGVDLVYVKIGKNKEYSYSLIKAESLPYTTEWKDRLSQGFNLSGKHLTKLDNDYGDLLAAFIADFIDRNAIKKLDLIASHGHTLFHKPEKGFTLQIGNGPQICKVNKIKTICDFRVQDVALGGQGAPLVPIGDKLLFGKYSSCLNLGGFANISFDFEENRIAFDCSPCNIVLNHYVKSLGLAYDNKGMVAKSGQVHDHLYNELNALEYYSLEPPKSLGFEFVSTEILPMVDKWDINTADILRTCLEHTAFQIAAVLNKYGIENCLVTGGGTHNDFLIKRIRALTNSLLILPDMDTIDYKEALIFAFLGFLKHHGLNNCLKQVTGAERDHSSGVIYNPE
jgi:anhydro-N-acetylmuramic acid kinase